MAIDYSLSRLPKGTPNRLARGWKKRERDAKLDAAYAHVDQRDGVICRVTGRTLRKGLPGAVPPKFWLTRHHMYGRHAALLSDVSAIFVCAWDVHQLLELNAIEIEGTNANRPLFFRWNRRVVPVGKEPFRLATRNRSNARARQRGAA